VTDGYSPSNSNIRGDHRGQKSKQEQEVHHPQPNWRVVLCFGGEGRTGGVGGSFESVVGCGVRNGKIEWFVVGGRLIFLVFLCLKNSWHLMCPV
jgi:hypothetical protein